MWVIKEQTTGEVVARSHDGTNWEFSDEEFTSVFETILIEGIARGRKNYVPGDAKFDELFWEEVEDLGYELEATAEKAELVHKPAELLAKLPKDARRIYEEVYNKAAKQYKGDKGKAAATAIEAVKAAGYKKEEESGKWVKRKMKLLDAYFTKASTDPDTGELRWAATVSKFERDDQFDTVTPEFFQSAIDAVEKGLRPPPVLCVSHVDKGKPTDAWVAGDTVEMFVDGERPKAKGIFRDTPIGRALFKAVRADIKNDVPHDERARISMGFYDEGSEPGVDGKGRVFRKGWIKHFAATRVPVVKETDLMTKNQSTEPVTLKDDLVSIIGEELATELLSVPDQVEKGLITKARADQLAEKIRELLMLLEDDAGEEEAEENRQALGNRGTNPARAVPAPKSEADVEKADDDDEEDEEEDEDEESPKEANIETEADEEEEEEEEEEKSALEKSEQADALVDSFATSVKVIVKGDGDRRAKFAAIQEVLNEFGEGVVQLVKGSTTPSAGDIGETVHQAVVEAIQPLQHELLQVKAELALLQGAGPPPATNATQPTSMDSRVVMHSAPIPASGARRRAPDDGPKLKSAYELAWESTATPRY